MPDLLTVQQLADYLQLSKRTIYRLVDRDQIPAVRVGGQWRFPKSAVDYWLDMRIGSLGPVDLDAMDAESSGPPIAITDCLSPANALIEISSGTIGDVVRDIVAAVQFPEPVERDLVAQRLLEREELCSTANPGGVAVLHTARWMTRVLSAHDLVAVVRSAAPLDFGALDGSRTDLFMLVLARNERHHLVLLTKMTRLCQEARFLDAVRAAGSPEDVTGAVARFERTLFAGRTS